VVVMRRRNGKSLYYFTGLAESIGTTFIKNGRVIFEITAHENLIFRFSTYVMYTFYESLCMYISEPSTECNSFSHLIEITLVLSNSNPLQPYE